MIIQGLTLNGGLELDPPMVILSKFVVGAYGDDISKGAAYVYNTDGTGEVKITASDGAQYNNFGFSVAILGDKILVGAYQNGVAGSTYVYNLDGTGEQKIMPSDGASGDRFGYSVAIN